MKTHYFAWVLLCLFFCLGMKPEGPTTRIDVKIRSDNPANTWRMTPIFKNGADTVRYSYTNGIYTEANTLADSTSFLIKQRTTGKLDTLTVRYKREERISGGCTNHYYFEAVRPAKQPYTRITSGKVDSISYKTGEIKIFLSL